MNTLSQFCLIMCVFKNWGCDDDGECGFAVSWVIFVEGGDHVHGRGHGHGGRGHGDCAAAAAEEKIVAVVVLEVNVVVAAVAEICCLQMRDDRDASPFFLLLLQWVRHEQHF